MMVLMGIGVKGKYSAETGRLDNSDQIAAIRRLLVVEFGMEMVPDRMSAAPTALGVLPDFLPSAYALG